MSTAVIKTVVAAAIGILAVAIIPLAIVLWVIGNPGYAIFFAFVAAFIGLIVVLAHFFEDDTTL